MKHVFVQKLLLAVAGIAGLFIGFSLLFQPITFEASAGITLAREPNILSEIRGMGGVILLAGVMACIGFFMPKWRWTALFITSFYLLGYGASRLLSVFLDGIPSPVLLSAMALEVGIGLVGVALLAKVRSPQVSNSTTIL